MQVSAVQIGDFHSKPGPRRGEQYAALDQIIDEALGLPTLGFILWPGDLFDSLSEIPDRNAIDQRLQRMADRCPVIICKGNHDKDGDLDGFARLSAKHPIFVISRPECIRVRIGGPVPSSTDHFATIFVLPYPQKAGLVSAGTAVGDVVNVAADVLEPIFMAAVEELETAQRRGDITLMIGHVNVAGSIVSAGQPNIGHEIELNPRHLDRLGPIFKGLNHIHRPQEISGAHYAGSVCRLDYGEFEAKSYLQIDFAPADPAHLAHGWMHYVTRLPIRIAPMFHVEGELRSDGFHYVADPHPDGWVGCDVRVRYAYKSSEKAILDESKVRADFVGALRLKIEGVAMPDRELRSPAVAAAKTLPDKIAAYRREDRLPAAVADKVQLLEQLHDAAPELLERVAAAIRQIEQGKAVAAEVVEA